VSHQAWLFAAELSSCLFTTAQVVRVLGTELQCLLLLAVSASTWFLTCCIYPPPCLQQTPAPSRGPPCARAATAVHCKPRL
jgi:hypothetical protein